RWSSVVFNEIAHEPKAMKQGCTNLPFASVWIQMMHTNTGIRISSYHYVKEVGTIIEMSF
ncbi:hypothetical protein L9F63_008923, partial [Diploptera punctata]